MNYEMIFSIVGLAAMIGWLVLLVSPKMPIWADRIAGLAIPLGLSVGYTFLLFAYPPQNGGFGTFAEITELFADPASLMAGWVHFLAFDLLVGAWICRKGREEAVNFWAVLPCLPITFLFGPAGFVCFSIVRGAVALKRKSAATN